MVTACEERVRDAQIIRNLGYSKLIDPLVTLAQHQS
jgi:hypothetical protein